MDEQQNYWQKRSIARLLKSEKKGLNTLTSILSIYDEAEKNIEKELQSLYANYSNKGILDKKELEKALTPTERKAFLRKVANKARKLGLDPDKVLDERYLARLTRLQALKDQIKFEVMNIAPQEVAASEKTYANILGSNYKDVQKDINTIGGYPAFSKLNTDIVDEILRNQWYGGNYSSRIWGNTDTLSERLPIVLGAALSSGTSYQKTAMMLRDEFKTSQYEASRLVRTESNFFHNQAELQSYIDDGILEYDYDAVMDGITSKVCRKLNNKRFKVSEAVVGFNYPPMHGHCRSTSAPVLEGDEKRVGTRAERTARLTAGPTNAQIKRKYTKKIQDSIKKPKLSPVEKLAKQFGGNELIDKLNKMIRDLDDKDPTRTAIIEAAKLHGWTENMLTPPAVAKFKVNLKAAADIAPRLTDFEQNLIVKNNITAQSELGRIKRKTGTLGFYSPDAKSITFTAKGAVRPEKDKLNTFFHELGHAVDFNLGSKQIVDNTFKRIIDGREVTFGRKYEKYDLPSEKDSFLSIMRADSRKEMYEIMKHRVTNTALSDDDKLTMLKGGSVNRMYMPKSYLKYMRDPKELFAEGYAIFRNDFEAYKDKLPNLFKYYGELTKSK